MPQILQKIQAITEAEASKKRCPEAYGRDVICHCIGSTCMAWVWHKEHERKWFDLNPSVSGSTKPPEWAWETEQDCERGYGWACLAIEPDQRLGYCGKYQTTFTVLFQE